MSQEPKHVACPVCGGPENQMWFSHIEKKAEGNYAVYVVECWSGDKRSNSKYHLFLAKIKIIKETEVDHIKELENKLDELLNPNDQDSIRSQKVGRE